ncbi:muramoyltetrapeptide carboxypeptidase [Mesobacillus persicus]|uniref:Muramoyltetrapeptide carboxypeptidase n=1 Tax=Mesobacillus persicus TaxID=930146 RepID=A0A1H7W8R5_9BACI|nr:LD-carboxypeptidase [Mesobacillus persicus]SEM17900.1 muramoyltetrapeptide carboxypeptidase [Mesobacillus persicus]
MIKPKRLQKGDTVGVIAPAGTPQPEKLEKGLIFLNQLGLNIKLGNHVFNQQGYLAGTDEERVEDLHSMFRDKEISAIFCARGGYGTARIASMIDYQLIKENPKIFWGYSDITFLHLAITQLTDLVTFHGPMIASDLGEEEVDLITKLSFSQLFSPSPIEYTEQISTLEPIVNGIAVGPLVGGNLSLITSSLGTRFEIETKGKILFIEEISEQPRVIDRMLNQLYMAGKLQSSAGIVFGDFNHCVAESGPSLTLEEVINHYVRLSNRPALRGFQIGHCSPNFAIPLNVTAMLDTKMRRLHVESGILS